MKKKHRRRISFCNAKKRVQLLFLMIVKLREFGEAVGISKERSEYIFHEYTVYTANKKYKNNNDALWDGSSSIYLKNHRTKGILLMHF